MPPSQLAKRSCLAHQNNAWKSIKVDGTTLDAWVTRLQDEVEGEELEERGDRPVKGEGEAIHQRVFFQKMDLRGCSSRRLGSMPPSLEAS